MPLPADSSHWSMKDGAFTRETTWLMRVWNKPGWILVPVVSSTTCEPHKKLLPLKEKGWKALDLGSSYIKGRIKSAFRLCFMEILASWMVDRTSSFRSKKKGVRLGDGSVGKVLAAQV